MKSIPQSKWKWYGHQAHFCCECCFHLSTQIGTYLVSTVGEHIDRKNRELRYAGQKYKIESIGASGDKYETMVFGITGTQPECSCPDISISSNYQLDLPTVRYLNHEAALLGHMNICAKVSKYPPFDLTDPRLERE